MKILTTLLACSALISTAIASENAESGNLDYKIVIDAENTQDATFEWGNNLLLQYITPNNKTVNLNPKKTTFTISVPPNSQIYKKCTQDQAKLVCFLSGKLTVQGNDCSLQRFTPFTSPGHNLQVNPCANTKDKLVATVSDNTLTLTFVPSK